MVLVGVFESNIHSETIPFPNKMSDFSLVKYSSLEILMCTFPPESVKAMP